MEEEIQLVYKKFRERERDRDRDEDRCRHRQSTLLDQFERLSIEIQLNQAMLKRSLSETATTRSTTSAITQRRSVDQRPKKLPVLLRSATAATGRGAGEGRKKQPQQQQQRAGMRKAVEKLLRSIFRGKDRGKRAENKEEVERDGRGANGEVVRAYRSRSRRACLRDLLLVPGM